MNNVTLDNIWRRLGGRKLISLMLGIGATILLAFYDKLDSNAVTAILGLTGAFAGGNVLEHWLQGRNGKVELVVPESISPTMLGTDSKVDHEEPNATEDEDEEPENLD